MTEATDYVHAEGRVIEEVNATGSKTFVYGSGLDEVLTMRHASTDYFVHADELGSTVAVSDASGVVEDFLYGDFGEILDQATFTPLSLTASVASSGLPYLYTGRRLDEESGLFHLRARYLEPRAGRFTTRDPIGVWGDAANLGNGYTYTGNSPWTWTDPTGAERLWGAPDGVFGCVLLENLALSLPPWASAYSWVAVWSGPQATREGCITAGVGLGVGAVFGGIMSGGAWAVALAQAGLDLLYVGVYESMILQLGLGDVHGYREAARDMDRNGPSTRSQATIDRYDLSPESGDGGGGIWLPLLGGFVPLVGEGMDIHTIASPRSSGTARFVALVSLGVNFLTAGFAPNFGRAAREGIEAGSGAARGAANVGPKVAKQMGPRGWTREAIDEAINSGDQIKAINKANG